MVVKAGVSALSASMRAEKSAANAGVVARIAATANAEIRRLITAPPPCDDALSAVWNLLVEIEADGIVDRSNLHLPSLIA